VRGKWQGGGVKTKPDKVEEPTAPYTTKQVTAQPGGVKLPAPAVKQADDAAFERVADKIFVERKELLSKLAQ
jgi:hypothetical protein